MQNINNPISIFINQEDGYKKNHETFLEQLKILYQDFKKRNEVRNKKWNQKNKQNSKDFLINVESQIYQSPITLVHSQWGQGKTYFFEELIYNCFLENNNQNVNLEKYGFKKILMIDLWKYVNNDDFVNDIIFDVYNFLLPNSKKFKNVFLKIVKSIVKITGIFKSAGMSFLDCLSKSNFNSSYELSDSKRKSIDNINKDLKDIEPTIIIFDNLERLENNVVFTFKLIQKISMINNLLIILPMDKDKLKIANVNLNDVDSWLEKYITLGNYFVFDQDYKDFLNKKIDNENKKYIDLINKILLVKKYDIRKIENKINFVVVNQIFNISKYHGIEYLCKICGIENSVDFYNNDVNIVVNFFSQMNKDFCHFIFGKINPFINQCEYKKTTKNNNLINKICQCLPQLNPLNYAWDFVPKWNCSFNKNNELNIIKESINKLKSTNIKNKTFVNVITELEKRLENFNNEYKQKITNLLLNGNNLDVICNYIIKYTSYLKANTKTINNLEEFNNGFIRYFSNEIANETYCKLKHISL